MGVRGDFAAQLARVLEQVDVLAGYYGEHERRLRELEAEVVTFTYTGTTRLHERVRNLEYYRDKTEALNIPELVENILDASFCHCGRRALTGECGRGMCAECDAVRCDIGVQCPYEKIKFDLPLPGKGYQVYHVRRDGQFSSPWYFSELQAAVDKAMELGNRSQVWDNYTSSCIYTVKV